MTDELEKRIEEAKKLLNENDYLVIPVTKGQMYLCDSCTEPVHECRYGAFGYTCSNLVCLNDAIKEQLDYKKRIAERETDE